MSVIFPSPACLPSPAWHGLARGLVTAYLASGLPDSPGTTPARSQGLDPACWGWDGGLTLPGAEVWPPGQVPPEQQGSGRAPRPPTSQPFTSLRILSVWGGAGGPGAGVLLSPFCNQISEIQSSEAPEFTQPRSANQPATLSAKDSSQVQMAPGGFSSRARPPRARGPPPRGLPPGTFRSSSPSWTPLPALRPRCGADRAPLPRKTHIQLVSCSPDTCSSPFLPELY